VVVGYDDWDWVGVVGGVYCVGGFGVEFELGGDFVVGMGLVVGDFV